MHDSRTESPGKMATIFSLAVTPPLLPVIRKRFATIWTGQGRRSELARAGAKDHPATRCVPAVSCRKSGAFEKPWAEPWPEVFYPNIAVSRKPTIHTTRATISSAKYFRHQGSCWTGGAEAAPARCRSTA